MANGDPLEERFQEFVKRTAAFQGAIQAILIQKDLTTLRELQKLQAMLSSHIDQELARQKEVALEKLKTEDPLTHALYKATQDPNDPKLREDFFVEWNKALGRDPGRPDAPKA